MIPGSDEFRLDALDELIAMHDREKTILQLREKALREKLAALNAERQNLCAHSSTIEESSYHEGNYDDVARSFYTVKCRRCGKVVKEWDKAHSWYG
jgi:hypothetical protein